MHSPLHVAPPVTGCPQNLWFPTLQPHSILLVLKQLGYHHGCRGAGCHQCDSHPDTRPCSCSFFRHIRVSYLNWGPHPIKHPSVAFSSSSCHHSWCGDRVADAYSLCCPITQPPLAVQRWCWNHSLFYSPPSHMLVSVCHLLPWLLTNPLLVFGCFLPRPFANPLNCVVSCAHSFVRMCPPSSGNPEVEEVLMWGRFAVRNHLPLSALWLLS